VDPPVLRSHRGRPPPLRRLTAGARAAVGRPAAMLRVANQRAQSQQPATRVRLVISCGGMIPVCVIRRGCSRSSRPRANSRHLVRRRWTGDSGRSTRTRSCCCRRRWTTGAAPDAGGQVIVDIDGVLVLAHSEKQDATATWKKRTPKAWSFTWRAASTTSGECLAGPGTPAGCPDRTRRCRLPGERRRDGRSRTDGRRARRGVPRRSGRRR